eukprot:scaffold6363_cov25-Tisochrysis_lutea.AAC.4
MSWVGTGERQERRRYHRMGSSSQSRVAVISARPLSPRASGRVASHDASNGRQPSPVARHGGWRGDREVHGLKDQVHPRRHGNYLARHQAELLVVVEYRVHVLDPNRVDGPVKDHPSPLVRGVLGAIAVNDSQDAIGPFVGNLVELTVQPSRRHRLRVETRRCDALESANALVREARKRGGEHAVIRRLAREGQPHDHEAMPDQEHFIHLEHLGDEGRHRLQPHVIHNLTHRAAEVLIVGRRQLDARKEVGGDAVEEGNVVREEFRHVDVPDRAEHQDRLVIIREGALQVAGGGEDRLDGAHAVVVMVLRGELL